MKINSYLTFGGNCREAMSFYKNCLGGDLKFQTLADSPQMAGLPNVYKRYIVHATLIKDNLVLMASDLPSEQSLIKGNAIALMLHCNSKSEIEEYYEKLSAGGLKDQPLARTYWGALAGNLIDKFGNHWMLHFQENPE
ncbi:MAG: VOC family protein [Cyclobacteriaceae bacterium]|nr:VOC family protein [Cyclobacteriaceae bacterium]